MLAVTQTAAPDKDAKAPVLAHGDEDAKSAAEIPSGNAAGALDESAHRLSQALEARDGGKGNLGAAAKTKAMKRPAACSQGVLRRPAAAGHVDGPVARSQGGLRRPAAAGSVDQCKRKAAQAKKPRSVEKPKAKGKKVAKVMKQKANKMTRECVYSRAYHHAKGALAPS